MNELQYAEKWLKIGIETNLLMTFNIIKQIFYMSIQSKRLPFQFNNTATFCQMSNSQT